MIALCSFADTTASIKAQIIKDITQVLSKKDRVKICNKDPNFQDIFDENENFTQTTCKNADFIITADSKNYKNLIKKDKIFIISTSYRDYENNKQTDIAAFFWQKGRPNLILNAKLLKKIGIKVPKTYKNYVE